MNATQSQARGLKRICALLWLLALTPVLFSGCKLPITNTNTITIENTGTNAVANVPTSPSQQSPTDIFGSASHLLNDMNGVAAAVKKATDDLHTQNTAETLMIEISIVILAGGVIYVCIEIRKIRRDLSEDMRNAERRFPSEMGKTDKDISMKAETSQETAPPKSPNENEDFEQALISILDQLEAFKGQLESRPQTAANLISKTNELKQLLQKEFPIVITEEAWTKLKRSQEKGGINLKKPS